MQRASPAAAPSAAARPAEMCSRHVPTTTSSSCMLCHSEPFHHVLSRTLLLTYSHRNSGQNEQQRTEHRLLRYMRWQHPMSHCCQVPHQVEGNYCDVHEGSRHEFLLHITRRKLALSGIDGWKVCLVYNANDAMWCSIYNCSIYTTSSCAMTGTLPYLCTYDYEMHAASHSHVELLCHEGHCTLVIST
jgi:hypothetical protein